MGQSVSRADPAEMREVELLVMLAAERAGALNRGPDGRYEVSGPAGSADVEEIAQHAGWEHGFEQIDNGWRQHTFAGAYDLTPERVRKVCKRLVASDLMVEHRPAQGRVHYGVAPDGDTLLRQLAGEGMLPELPESPAHRRWREKRDAALIHVEELREVMRGTARACLELADATDPTDLMIDDGYTEERGYHPPMNFRWHNAGTRVEKACEELIEALLNIAQEEPE